MEEYLKTKIMEEYLKTKIMEKYLSAVSEMYSQFKKKEAHPMEKYIGRFARIHSGEILEVVGYSPLPDGSYHLIVDRSRTGGWEILKPCDVVFKKCEYYWYISISDLIYYRCV